MKKKLMLLAMSLLLVLSWVSFPDPATAAPGVIYVDADADGGNNGTTWEDAYTNLQDALSDAEAGNQIWVAEGIYKPGTSRSDTFILKEGVEIFGGFNGTETKLAQRNPDPSSNGTILSGDIGATEDNSDNIYHVVTAGSGVTSSAVLDGFTITAGNADGDASDSFGAGLYNRGSISLTLANCNFSDNSATSNGGGMYNRDSLDSISVTIVNCNFSGNSAGTYGGGMDNNASSITLTDCNFSSNSAEYGGGMANLWGSILTLTDCTFSGNSATTNGGGMYNEYSNPILTGCTFSGNSATTKGGGMYGYSSSPTLTGCTFSGNTATDPSGNPAIDPRGGGMYNRNNSNPTLTNCTFNGNSADYSGGGMMNYNSSNPTLTGCTFSDNSAAFWGGGMLNFSSSPALTDCMFSSNSTEDGHGGGMSNYDGSNPTITGCTFSDNSAAGFGGGIANEFSSPALTDCIFSINLANTYGGGMYNDSSSPILINCIFSGNSAQLGGGMGNYYEESSPALNNCIFSGNSAQLGGGIYNESSNPELTNCTFYGNSATTDGGGIHNSDSTSPTLTNCILWSNGGTAKTAQIYNDINSTPVINYCCIQGWTTGGTGNIGDDPLFIDAAGGNLQLSVGSPCVDSGTDDGAPTEDIEGNPRPVDGNGDKVATTDMGAYESAFLSNFISVTSTPEGASFTISGAVSYSGTTPWNVNETLTGEYTIAWGDLGGYTKPSGETKELTDEGSISFEGDYIPITHDLNMAVSGNGTISPSVGSHTYNEGTVVNITAAPDSGWQFDSWTGNVDDTSSVNTTVTMNGNEAITANFIELTRVIYDLTIAVDGNGTTSPLKGSHTYNEGTVVNITANHDPGWQFDNWTGDVADPNSASTTVTIDGDKTVTANFTEETQDGETGGCCSCSSSDVSANELAIGWGIIGLCWGGGYYMVRRSRNRKI